jgi:hypothetical protein
MRCQGTNSKEQVTANQPEIAKRLLPDLRVLFLKSDVLRFCNLRLDFYEGLLAPSAVQLEDRYENRYCREGNGRNRLKPDLVPIEPASERERTLYTTLYEVTADLPQFMHEYFLHVSLVEQVIERFPYISTSVKIVDVLRSKSIRLI